MEKVVIEDISRVCENELLLKDLVNSIKMYENTLLNKMECTPNSCFQWILRLEDDESCPIFQGFVDNGSRGKIKIGINFIKNVYALVCFLTDYYSNHLAGKSVSNHDVLFKEICRNKSSFADACKNGIFWNTLEKEYEVATEWERNAKENNKVIFFYAIHYFINHEIGHTVHLGDGADVEERCDDEATKVMFKLLEKNIKVLHMDNDCILKIGQIMYGGFVAQAIIAHYVKKSTQNTSFDDDPQIENSNYPKTYERIYNFIKRFNLMWCYGRINELQHIVDESFAYMLMTIIFLYRKFDLSEILEYQNSYRDMCTELLKMLCIVPHEKMVTIFSKRRFCRDEYIGLMRFKNEKWTFSRRDDYDEVFVPAEDYSLACKEPNMGEPIVFVLESPHKSEFFKRAVSTFNSNESSHSRPAKGYTKTMFDRHVDTVFNNLEIPQSSLCHPVIILNACRFQCSLGKKIVRQNSDRDRMFKLLFESDIACLNKSSLKKRLQELHPYAVVSASTKGGNPDYIIREKVDDVINNCGVLFYKAYHPAGWRNPDYRVKRG